MAARRLFFLQHHLQLLLPPPARKHMVACKAKTTPTTCKAKTNKTKNTNSNSEKKKKQQLQRDLDERLKRRTRSDAAFFDPDLYRRFSAHHVPVMLGEVLAAFRRPPHLRSFVDCTLGAAGHSLAMMEAHPEMELYIGMDVDPCALNIGRDRIQAFLVDSGRGGGGGGGSRGSLQAYTHIRNFKYIKHVLGGVDESLALGSYLVDGILIDLGMSSMQVDKSHRGFSVLQDGPLDMRMDPQATLKAEDILNSWPELEVGRILRDYGEESNWQSLQKKIVKARELGGVHSTGELVKLIQRMSNMSGGRQGWIKTATRVFQALRIAVNDELQTLEDSLYSCFDCLASGGRLAVISFHSLEDRIVKQTFLDLIDGDGPDDGEDLKCTDVDNEVEESWFKHKVRGRNGTVLTRRPITPSIDEEKLNPRCRSAKLRVIQKA